MPSTAPYSIITAFADNANAGNPAVIVFVDVDKYPREVYGKLSQNFNEPITAFVSPRPRPESTKRVLHYDIRCFAPNTVESPLCGHGTLAAGKAVLDTDHATDAVEAIIFHTKARGIVTVWKRSRGLFELSLPSHMVSDPDRGQYALTMRVLRKTFGREVAVNYIGLGTQEWKKYILIELDEKENLKDLYFNAPALTELGRIFHVFTARCSTGPELFHSRVFIPGFMPGDEDPVCGTAHCLLAPYWSKKLGIPRGTEIKAKQVSARGGDLTLVWDADVEKTHLKGKMTDLAHGEVILPS